MGVFAKWQPRYAEHKIATFPVNDDKKPLVSRYDRIGVKASGQLAFDLRFESCGNLGFMAGKRSNLTIVDVDTDDEAIWREAEKVFGPTPLWVRTGRGHLQMWYRHNGEARDTESKFLGCVDLLGSGQVLGFPSRRGHGYEAIRGGLHDIDRLPMLRGLDRLTPANNERIGVGSRQNVLFTHLQEHGRHCDDLDQLIDVGMTFADLHMDRHTGHAFTDAEITATAKSVWDWTQERIKAGEYFVGVSTQRLVIAFDAATKAMTLGADAFMLYSYLKMRSNHRTSLIVANDMRLAMPDGEWALRRFTRARAALIDAGILKLTRPASTWHGPATYAWQG